MNSFFGLIVMILSSSVIAIPPNASRRDEPVDTEVIERRTSVPRVPHFWPDFSEFERQIQESIDRTFHSIPRIHFDTKEFNLPEHVDPASVKNETIEDTKIVDGKVIETKERTYSAGDKSNGHVFRIKTVNIYPANYDKTTVTPQTNFVSSSSQPDKDVEIVLENENSDPEMSALKVTSKRHNNIPFYDLSHDTDVNKYVSSATIDPDSELINVNEIMNNQLPGYHNKYYYSTIR